MPAGSDLHRPPRTLTPLLLLACAVVLSACGVLTPATATTPTSPAGSASASSRSTGAQPGASPGSAAPGTTTTPVAVPDPTTGTTPGTSEPGTALALLGTLPVKGRAPMTGYSRAAFGAAWTDTDRNGCDQRNDTLRRDLHSVTLKAGTHGCTVMTGVLTDPYSSTRISFARGSGWSPVQIDHVVPLADAWVKGAQRWDEATRTRFANDPLNLLAVASRVNEAKGSGDAATWLPPARGYRCAYVARQVAVKARYGLSVTPAEHGAMAGILATCVGTRVPTAVVAPLGGFPTYRATPGPGPGSPQRPSPAPSPTSPPSAPAQGVHPGAFCSPEGALGRTRRGTLMRCSTTASDPRARWRSAP